MKQREDRFDQVIRATVRVTVSGVCGSGTVVVVMQWQCFSPH